MRYSKVTASLLPLLTLHCSPCAHFIAPPAHTSLLLLLTLHCSPCAHFIAPPAHTSLLPLLTLHCSPFSHFIAPPVHTSLLPLLTHFLPRQPQPEGLSHHCLTQPSDSLYLHKSCSLSPLAFSIILKPIIQFLLQSGHLNRYMHHHP